MLPLVLATLALAASVTGRGAAAQRQSNPAGTEPPFNESVSEILGGLEGWRDAPAYVDLFAPEAHQSQYRAFVSADPLLAAVTRIRAAVGNQSPGAWGIEDLGPLDAFGLSGRFTPYYLARLYTAGPVHVARGPHAAGQGYDAWTLFSPYPDPALRRLSTGTLLLVMRVPPL